MHIRKATLDDAELLVKLNREIQHIHAEALPEMFKPAQFTPELLQLYREWLVDENNTFFIAEVEGQVVGCAYAKVTLRPENPFVYAHEELVIDQIGISPAHQGKGYGEALLQRVFALAREKGIGTVTLIVYDFNTQARQFYEKHGFSDIRHQMVIDVNAK